MVRSAARRLSWGLGLAAAVSALVLTGGSPAQAGTNVSVYTTDGNPGGYAYFESYGEHVYACDEEADGYRVRATLAWMSGGEPRVGIVEDTNGANGDCAHANYSIPEGVSVALEVCLRDGTTGPFLYCRDRTGVA